MEVLTLRGRVGHVREDRVLGVGHDQQRVVRAPVTDQEHPLDPGHAIELPLDPPRRYGGWSYYDTYRTSLRTDISTARFALQGLAATELPGDAPAWQRASLFLGELQNHSLIVVG